MEGGHREMRDRAGREKLLSIRELWPQAAVPAVAKSGQKAIDYTPRRTPGMTAVGGRQRARDRGKATGLLT